MGLIYPGFPGGRTALGLLAVRLAAGAAFILHGWPKMQNAFSWMGPDAKEPGLLQAAAAFTEFVGGIAWLLGALTPLISLMLGVTMCYAIVNYHMAQGHPFVSTGGQSFELALAYLSVAILLLLAGPGKLSLDYCVFGGERK